MVKLVNSTQQKLIPNMNKLKYLFTIFTLCFCLVSFGQETKVIKKQKKMLEKQEIEKKKSEEKSMKLGKKRHEKIQTKATRKRMKQSAKKSKNGGQPKKKFFILRWFS